MASRREGTTRWRSERPVRDTVRANLTPWILLRRERKSGGGAPSAARVVISFPLFSRRLIQYRPCVHQLRSQRFCPGAEHAAGHPRKFARGRAQCSACRIKRKTNVNYGRIALQRPRRSAGVRQFPLSFALLEIHVIFCPPAPDAPIFPRKTHRCGVREI